MPNPLKRLLVRWPQKLGALVLAILLWLFVANNDPSTTQRSVLVPITVQGIATNEVVVGLAEAVEVTFTGPSTQVARLEPADIEAVLDLSGVDGDFTERIQVETPRGITLGRVRPSSLQGLVTSVTTRAFPVVAVPGGAVPADLRFAAQIDPALGGEATVRGRREVLERVDRVLMAVPLDTLGEIGGEVTARPFAVDARGLPVPGTEVSPAEATVTASLRPSLRRAVLAVELAAPGGGVRAVLERDTVTVAAVASALAGLERIRATVDPATAGLPPGSYTLPVVLELPDGVTVAEIPRATVTVPARQATP